MTKNLVHIEVQQRFTKFSDFGYCDCCQTEEQRLSRFISNRGCIVVHMTQLETGLTKQSMLCGQCLAELGDAGCKIVDNSEKCKQRKVK